MTDPERFSQRSTGLAAELLRAGADDQPGPDGMQQTLAALGFSGVVLSSAGVAGAASVGSAPLTSAVSASAATSGLTTAGAIKSASATLVIKWVGIGLVGGVGLASVASVAARPSPKPSAVVIDDARSSTAHVNRAAVTPTLPESRPAVADSPAPQLVASAAPSALHAVAVAVESRLTNSELEVGELLAAEVAYVDRARARLAAGQSSQGLSLLAGYEQKFRGARLLPEVLFLQIEAYERTGQSNEARNAAQRLVADFPKSPHAGRARRLLAR